MAYAKVYFRHPQTRQMREAPVGFSWTTLFFGFIPALFRGDWIGAVIQFVVGCMTFGLSNLIFMFIYNKMYIKRLIGEGFQVTGATGDLAYIEKRLNQQLPRQEE